MTVPTPQNNIAAWPFREAQSSVTDDGDAAWKLLREISFRVLLKAPWERIFQAAGWQQSSHVTCTRPGHFQGGISLDLLAGEAIGVLLTIGAVFCLGCLLK